MLISSDKSHIFCLGSRLQTKEQKISERNLKLFNKQHLFRSAHSPSIFSWAHLSRYELILITATGYPKSKHHIVDAGIDIKRWMSLENKICQDVFFPCVNSTDKIRQDVVSKWTLMEALDSNFLCSTGWSAHNRLVCTHKESNIHQGICTLWGFLAPRKRYWEHRNKTVVLQ